MNTAEAINDEIRCWKEAIRLAAQLYGGGLPSPCFRQASADGRYFAVAVMADRSSVLGLATAEHHQGARRTVVVTRLFGDTTPPLSLPPPFNALALSHGDGELVAEIPTAPGKAVHFRSQDAE